MALIDNLLAYWKLDESSGDAIDATGNGKTLTNNNTVAYAASLINNGADFGTANTNKFFKRSGFIGTDGVGSFSLWVKMRTEIATGTQTFFINVQESTTFLIDYEYNAGTRRLVLRRQKASSPESAVTQTITLGTANWYHIVGTYSGSNINLYVNNVANAPVAASGNGVSNFSPGGGFTSIGSMLDANIGTTSQYASAYVDEVAWWSKVLTATEIGLLYNSGSGYQYPFVPILTSPVSSISSTSATGNGTVVSDEGFTIFERGFVWSTTPTPTTSNGKVIVSGTLGVYSGALTSLSVNTLYYVRSYYRNSAGTTYGNQVTFTTLSISPYDLQLSTFNADAGDTFIGQITVTGTLGTITVKLGSTGTSTVINAGAGAAAFSGTYSGLSGLIITRSANFNGTIDNVYYTKIPLGATIDWSLNTVALTTPIASEVFFKRVEDTVFNSFRFYRYLDLLFKDLDGYVTVTVRQEREDNTTEKTKTFSVGNVGSGTVSPFQKKRISFLCKDQAIIIGLSNANLNETFSIAQYLLLGDKMPKRSISPTKIISV